MGTFASHVGDPGFWFHKNDKIKGTILGTKEFKGETVSPEDNITVSKWMDLRARLEENDPSHRKLPEAPGRSPWGSAGSLCSTPPGTRRVTVPPVKAGQLPCLSLQHTAGVSRGRQGAGWTDAHWVHSHKPMFFRLYPTSEDTPGGVLWTG